MCGCPSHVSVCLISGLLQQPVSWGAFQQCMDSFPSVSKGKAIFLTFSRHEVKLISAKGVNFGLNLALTPEFPFLGGLQVFAPLTDGLDPIRMLTDDATVAAWQNQGLPNDRMSTENAAILTISERWPLIIDPQQQALKWIRNWFGSKLRVVQLRQKRSIKTTPDFLFMVVVT